MTTARAVLVVALALALPPKVRGQQTGISVTHKVLVTEGTRGELVCKSAQTRIYSLLKSGLPLQTFRCAESPRPLEIKQSPYLKAGFSLSYDEKEKVQQFDYLVRRYKGGFASRNLELKLQEIRRSSDEYYPLSEIVSYVLVVIPWRLDEVCGSQGKSNVARETIQAVKQLKNDWENFGGWLSKSGEDWQQATFALGEAVTDRLKLCENT